MQDTSNPRKKRKVNVYRFSKPHVGKKIDGKCYVQDGDTIRIKSTWIRISQLDAPELSTSYGKAAKWTLFNICKGKTITATLSGHMSYERHVAKCHLNDGSNLANLMIQKRMAKRWRRKLYSKNHERVNFQKSR